MAEALGGTIIAAVTAPPPERRGAGSAGIACIDKWRAEALSRVDSALAELLHDTGGLASPLSHVTGVRGKRLRALVTLAAASLAPNGRERAAEAVKAAAAVEAIHEASLIHDDIVDGAQVRRNQRALVARFGVHTAGHTGVYLAGKGLARLADICARQGLRLDFGILQNLALSQILDSLPPAADFQTQYQRQLIATDGKTGVLFLLAVRVGAALAQPFLSAHGRDLDGFASALGRAFQIRDDILDIEGDPPLQRQDVSDLQGGVLSWPLCLWAGMAGDWGEATARLRRCREQFNEAVALHAEVLRSGAMDRARSLMATQLDRAARRLARLPSSEGRSRLVHFLDELRLK